MPPSQAAITVSNFDIGPCQVIWNAVDLGGTHDNVKIKFKYDKSFLTADQTGKSKLDAAVSGIECTVATSFLETRNKTNFANLFPTSLLNGTTHKYIQFSDQTGVRQLALAQPLQLHPLVDAASSNDNEWYFYKALPAEDSEYDFGPAVQAKLKITWTILLDLTTTPGRLFRAGDHTL
jgi:hypothetical protein